MSHRTSIILDLFPSSIWRHISTTSNPADHCSRGLSPKELKDCKLWWSGPGWLLLPPENWLKPTPISLKNVLEIRPVVLSIAPQPVFSLWNKYSSFSKLVRIVAYCLRFLFHCKFPVSQTIPMSIELFYTEIANAKELLYHFSQLMYFCQDYSTLKSGKIISKSFSLHSLKPFIDQSNLIRVGGRLGYSKT